MKTNISLFLAIGVAAAIVIGCGKKTEEPASGSSEDTTASVDENTPEVEEGVKADFSSPTAAVETMIAAAVAKDIDVLAQCFSEDAAGEFGAVREKKASDEDLLEFAEFMSGGTVTGEEISADGATATVAAKLGRDEEISLKKTDDGWKVVDF